MENCTSCSCHGHLCIDNIPIFNDLTHEEKESVMDASHHKKYKKGEMIFTPGDSFDSLFVVNKGIVKIFKLSILGKEQILRVLEPGDFMGELSLFSKTILSNNAQALENSEICIIKGSMIMELLMKKPEIGIKFLQKYTQRIEESEELIEQIGLRDVEQRIANYLLLEIEKNVIEQKNNEYEITLPMSKKDFAALIGTSQETLSRKLSLFQDNGWIKLKEQRKIIVTAMDSLKDINK
ncbi:MAG: Crp/Fnr family transcriptional regulator [Sedimentibacter sp.]